MNFEARIFGNQVPHAGTTATWERAERNFRQQTSCPMTVNAYAPLFRDAFQLRELLQYVASNHECRGSIRV